MKTEASIHPVKERLQQLIDNAKRRYVNNSRIALLREMKSLRSWKTAGRSLLVGMSHRDALGRKHDNCSSRPARLQANQPTMMMMQLMELFT
jgi:hypothetical protein